MTGDLGKKFVSETNERMTELPLKTEKMAWEKWIGGAGQEYLDMNRIISVSQIKMFLRSAFEAGFEANEKAYQDLIEMNEKHYRNELDFINKTTMKNDYALVSQNYD